MSDSWIKDLFSKKKEKNTQDRVDKIALTKKMNETGTHAADNLNKLLDDFASNKKASNGDK